MDHPFRVSFAFIIADEEITTPVKNAEMLMPLITYVTGFPLQLRNSNYPAEWPAGFLSTLS